MPTLDDAALMAVDDVASKFVTEQRAYSSYLANIRVSLDYIRHLREGGGLQEAPAVHVPGYSPLRRRLLARQPGHAREGAELVGRGNRGVPK
jgi:hypothetical protein